MKTPCGFFKSSFLGIIISFAICMSGYAEITDKLPDASITGGKYFWVTGVVRDGITSTPASGAMIILARKTLDGTNCTVNIKLTGVTDGSGRFSIDNVLPGQYVVLYNLSGIAKEEWQGKEIPVKASRLALSTLMNDPKGLNVPITIVKGSKLEVVGGDLVITGYLYAKDMDLIMIVDKGELLSFDIKRGNEELSLRILTTVY